MPESIFMWGTLFVPVVFLAFRFGVLLFMHRKGIERDRQFVELERERLEAEIVQHSAFFDDTGDRLAQLEPGSPDAMELSKRLQAIKEQLNQRQQDLQKVLFDWSYIRTNFAQAVLAGVSIAAAHGFFLYLAQARSWFGENPIPIFSVILDTLCRGAFLDLVESYHLGFTDFQPNQHHFLFNTSTFVFRTAWSAITAYSGLVVVIAVQEYRKRAGEFRVERP